MTKKINSEIKFNDNLFKVKIGTTNKKKPETFYIELGTYITPLCEKDGYHDDINKFEKIIKRIIKSEIKNSNICNSDNIITILDIANDRILYKKKSYMEIQFFIKTQKIDFKKNIFKEISKEVHDNHIISMINEMKDNLNNMGFMLSKTKNKG
jgi:hypothetical protein